MSLLKEFMQPCMIMSKTKASDGDGGYTDTWTASTAINAAIVLDNSTMAKIAEKQGVSSAYTITTNKQTILKFHDVVKRLSDGAYFRVTSDGNEKKTPNSAAINMVQVTAEKWELPT